MHVITKRTFLFLFPILFALLMMMVARHSVWAQAITTKLNPPITATAGYVTHAAWSPDGSFFVYSEEIEDKTEDNCLYCPYMPGRLYLKFVNHDSPFLISNNLNEVKYQGSPENHGFAVSSDSKYIVYDTADGKLQSMPLNTLQSSTITSGITTWQKFHILRSENRVLTLQSVEGAQHLVSFAVTGGDPLIVSNELPELSDVVDFFVSPDESRVIYLIDQEEHARSAIYSVELKNGHTTKLLIPRSTNDKIINLGVTPNSEHLIITTGEDEQSQIFSVSLSDGSVINLIPSSNGAWNEIKYFTWSLDSKYIIYIADLDIDARDELYSVPVNGGASIKLNASLPDGGDVVRSYEGDNIAISVDNNLVIYQADQEIDDQYELFSVPITGGKPLKLNGPLIANGDVDYFVMTPDKLSVIYVSDQEQDGFSEIYSTKVDGTSTIKLNRIVADAPLPKGDVYPLTISQDNSIILFQSGDDLFKISTTDKGVTQINLTSLRLDHEWPSNKWWMNPDATQLLYLAQNKQTNLSRNELYAYPINGGESRKVNAPLAIGGDVWEYHLSPDGNRVVFQGTIINYYEFDAYDVSLADSNAVKLSNTYIGPGLPIHFSANGKHIAYVNGMNELWSVDLDQARTSSYSPTMLSSYYTFGLFDITPNSENVIFEKWINPNSSNSYLQLYSVPISGGTPFPIGNSSPTLGASGADGYGDLQSTLRNSENIIQTEQNMQVEQTGRCQWSFDTRATRDNQHVLVKGIWLSNIPLDGTPFIRLYSSPSPSEGVTQFAESEDGKFVVFRKGCNLENANDLYSVPYTGGEPTKLNATRPISGNVADFQISYDSTFVVYKADQAVYQEFDLYSVPVTGGVPVMLNNPLVNGGTVQDFALTPDGKSVIYRAEQEASNVAELYQVPAGGGVPRKLNSSLVSGGNVKLFFVTGNQWVVYLADQEVDERFELYSASLADGKIVKLSGNLQSAGNIVDVAVSPDGTFAVYRADQEQDEVYEIYHVPSVGGTITKLNLPLVSGGDVREFTISADNTHIVYLADQEIDTVVELYSSVIATHRLFLPVVSR